MRAGVLSMSTNTHTGVDYWEQLPLLEYIEFVKVWNERVCPKEGG